MPDTQTLPQLVRSKYPGVYDDISDADLDAKVRAKYPGVYDDIPKPTLSKADVVAKVRQGNQPPASTYLNDVGRYATGELKGFARGLTDIINPITYIDMASGVQQGLKDLPAYVHGFSKEDITTHLPVYIAQTVRDTISNPEALGRVLGNVVTSAAMKGTPITEGGPSVREAIVSGRDALANKLPIDPAMQAIANKLGLGDQFIAHKTGLSLDDVALARKYGFDPDRIELATAKMKLQAAQHGTRIAKQLRQWAEEAAADATSSETATQAPVNQHALVLTPEQIQMHGQQMSNAALIAKEQGMKSAAYGKAAWKAGGAK